MYHSHMVSMEQRWFLNDSLTMRQQDKYWVRNSPVYSSPMLSSTNYIGRALVRTC